MPVLVQDVAEVVVAPMPRHGAVTHDGVGESVSGMVILLKGENAKVVAARVKERIAEIVKTLPHELSLHPFYDQTEVIDRTTRTLLKNLLEGSLLVILVLFLFLRDVRAALLVAAVIPLAMLTGFIGMRAFGVSANLMSLGAIDFGLIVDGAVVMMENFLRHRGERPASPPSDSVAQRLQFFITAATEVARPVLFGVLIIVAVYLPIFTLEGLEGKMFRPMAITVCSAILGSLVLSLTAIPVLASLLLRSEGEEHEVNWFQRLRQRYLALLSTAMTYRLRTVSVGLLVVAVAIGSIPFLGTEFMPKLDEGSILIETRKLPSISLTDSVEISSRIERLLLRFPEVKQVVTKTGRPDLATEAMGIYQGDVYVILHPLEEWTAGRDKDALIQAMANALAEMPGVSANFTQPMAMRLDEVVSGVKADVAVKIFGPDFATLERLGQHLNVPFALVGGVAALWLRSLNLNLSASIGFIALFGVAVLNGLVLITAINHLREEGVTLREAILAGTSRRLKPVLMTALVAAFGFVPMALSHSAGAEVQRPLATVVIGGILTSTALTLIVLPCLYEWIEERVLRRAR
ncbi:MAG: efflux RND transporter permease subunit [Deltaproteobacteria bacterium]|nr:efflux RND transporter permease subunit [Deltaproteobacteria bacterium]